MPFSILLAQFGSAVQFNVNVATAPGSSEAGQPTHILELILKLQGLTPVALIIALSAMSESPKSSLVLPQFCTIKFDWLSSVLKSKVGMFRHVARVSKSLSCDWPAGPRCWLWILDSQ